VTTYGAVSRQEAGEVAELEAAAVALARTAGDELLRRFAAPVSVRYKSSRGRDPVTEADEAVEALLRREVRRRFPAHGFLGEEGGGDAAAEFLWVVDPLDGTANFANGVPIFSVSIGVLRRGVPVAAALFTAFGPDGTPCVLHARRGGGLHRDGARYVPRTASARGRLVGVPAGFHRRFRQRLLRRLPSGETRSLGSIAAELGLVACGRLRFGLWESPKIWDVAAGMLLVHEGGGSVLVTRAGRWEPFESFQAPGRRSLKDWRGSVLAGEPDALAEFTRALHIHPSPVERLERLVGPDAAFAVERGARLSWRASAPVRRGAGWMVRAARRI